MWCTMTINLTIPLQYDVVIQDVLDESRGPTVSFRPHPRLLALYPTDCGTEFTRYKKNGKVYYRRHTGSTTALHKRTCSRCAESEAKSKATKAFHRLMAFEWSNMWGITLTTPNDYFDLEMVHDNDYVLSRKKDFLKLCKLYMDRVHPRVPYQTYFHHWATANPMGPPHFHMHISALCAEYSFEKEGGLIDKQLEPFVDLETSKEEWRIILGMQDTPVLHYQFISRRTKAWEENGEEKTRGGPRKIHHWLNYCYRAYIGDVERFLEKHDKDPNLDQRKWLRFHMREGEAIMTIQGESFSPSVGSWGRRIGSHRQLANRNRTKFTYDEEVQSRIDNHVQLTRELFTPDTRKPIVNSDRMKGGSETIVRRMRKDEVLVSKRVFYVDRPELHPWDEIHLPSPYSCMQWTSYHEIKSPKDSGKVPCRLASATSFRLFHCPPLGD